MHTIHRIAIAAALCLSAGAAHAQDAFLDSLVLDTTPVEPLPAYFFAPAVYDHYDFPDSIALEAATPAGPDYLQWLREADDLQARMQRMRHRLFFGSPDATSYLRQDLPEAPKQFSAVVDPSSFKVTIVETVLETPAPTVAAEEVKKRHWISTFNVSLQFSQAYISPNWYQGGNNALNMLGQIYYNVKLNQEFHPNLLFETTAQYKLGMNNAPDDKVHDYNINDDLFQVNSTFGLKAANHWYYSLSGQFKTQLLNSYEKNSTNLRSGFLSPGDLTVGAGMSYSNTNKKKTVTFDANLAPISYNLRICTSDRLDHSAYDIRQDRTTAHKFGSNVELKLQWKMTHNISLRSRIYAFTDYHTVQADWENTLMFEINRFLTTQIYAHARYDSATPPTADSKWRKVQLKEILSIGFAYKFASV